MRTRSTEFDEQGGSYYPEALIVALPDRHLHALAQLGELAGIARWKDVFDTTKLEVGNRIRIGGSRVERGAISEFSRHANQRSESAGQRQSLAP